MQIECLTSHNTTVIVVPKVTSQGSHSVIWIYKEKIDKVLLIDY